MLLAGSDSRDFSFVGNSVPLTDCLEKVLRTCSNVFDACVDDSNLFMNTVSVINLTIMTD